ncbi:MAG: hypothetical protein JNL75_08435 [Chitinophagales bacterium]|nr:hypothetical protein [Chitinophagales bacterium]
MKNKLSKVVKKATLFNKLVLLSCFFFSVATTLPHEEIILNKTNSIEYNVNISKTELLSKLTPLNNYSGAQEYNIRDTLFIIYISNNKERVESIVNIQEISKNITKIRFDKFNSVTIEGGFSGVEEELKTKWKTKSTEDYNYYIQNHFIDKIIAGDFQYIYFDNLRIHNEWKNKEKDRQRATIIIN